MKTSIKHFSIGKRLGALVLLCLGLTGCSDEWDNHYGKTADTSYGNVSLYELLKADPAYSDFCEVLEATRTFDNSKQTQTNYATLLSGDQFFTVWAPVNGSFDKQAYLDSCKTSSGDSLTELQFVKNHIARYSQSINGKTYDVMLLNGKTTTVEENKIGSALDNTNKAVMTSCNIAARNGILHKLETPIQYRHNIYEALAVLPKYDHIGQFLRKYQVDELNETASLAMGIVDGKTVYIDSVFRSWNSLLYDGYYGVINSEDSSYLAVVPDSALWDSLYKEASNYYNYPNTLLTRDSLQRLWAHYALMQDMFYNKNKQRSIQDSVTSTTWYKSATEHFHTYYHPYGEEGIFSHPSWTMACSNGIIYEVNKWPFDKYNTYFKKVSVEAESQLYKYGPTTITTETRWSTGDSISNGWYRFVSPKLQTDASYIEYNLPGLLAGDYDVCVVFLPRNVNPSLDFTTETTEGKNNRNPAKFIAEITYVGTDGKTNTVNSRTKYKKVPDDAKYYVKGGTEYLFECNYQPTSASNRAFYNDPFRIDTIKLCTMHFPTCNFAQTTTTNRLKLTNAIVSNESKKYWKTWFIDQILLIPHKEEK